MRWIGRAAEVRRARTAAKLTYWIVNVALAVALLS